MDLTESLRMSWRTVRDHTLRSTLTTLGIVIGVAAVITFVMLGASLQADIVQTIAGENTDVMYVTASGGDGSGLPSISGTQAVFTRHDVEGIREIDGVGSVVPIGGIATSAVSFDNDSVGRQWVTITTPAYFRAKGHTFVAGGPFDARQREVVLNQQAARMFDRNVSVGDRIVLTRAAGGERINVTVAGIVEEQTTGGGSFFLRGAQPAIYAPPVPLYERTVVSPTTGQDQRVYAQLLVGVDDVTRIEAVQGRVQTYLAESSDARFLAPEGYELTVTTYDQLVRQIEQVSSTFTAYITGIAVISLVVGSIGIANIMLVSVAERTREIGIMKAVGAPNASVLQLFLVEAALLGLAGSVLGAVVGLAGGYLGTMLLDLPVRLRPEWFAVAVLVGLLVGVLAGLYPAWTAARTDPIEALRHE